MDGEGPVEQDILAGLRRAVPFLYLATLALLPWSTWPPFSWLHEHVQWSDLVFAGAAAAWALERLRAKDVGRPRLVHLGLAFYLAAAAASLVAADPRPSSGPAKLLGLAMLVTLTLVTADVGARPGMRAAIGRTVAATALVVSVAAVLGVLLAAAGVTTPLVGVYGDLLPGVYARAQAGFPHPNLLASFCVFAVGVVGREGAGLSAWQRRVVTGALAVTVALTFSRAILAFGLALVVRAADTPRRRRLAAVFAGLSVAAIVALSTLNLALDPTRPLAGRLLEAPSPRAQAFVTALATLRAHPGLGVGPGASPGRVDGQPFDAHCTPLNVAATLGLPALFGFVLVPCALWRSRSRPTDRATWGMLAGLALDGLGQDVEDFRHLWVAFGLAAAESRPWSETPRATLSPE
jgi:hypothetical protein